jgi:hypothetical protein
MNKKKKLVLDKIKINFKKKHKKLKTKGLKKYQIMKI